MSYNTTTKTSTYTVTDIRKTFENCIADIRMIAGSIIAVLESIS